MKDDRPWRGLLLLLACVAICYLICWNVAVACAETLYTVTEVNVRTGPGTDHHAYATLEAGEPVELEAWEGEWVRVQACGDVGYINGQYLARTLPETPQTATVTADKLRVRDNPSAEGAVLKRLKKGTTVQVVGWCDEWANVGSGWVDGRYLN